MQKCGISRRQPSFWEWVIRLPSRLTSRSPQPRPPIQTVAITLSDGEAPSTGHPFCRRKLASCQRSDPSPSLSVAYCQTPFCILDPSFRLEAPLFSVAKRKSPMNNFFYSTTTGYTNSINFTLIMKILIECIFSATGANYSGCVAPSAASLLPNLPTIHILS